MVLSRTRTYGEADALRTLTLFSIIVQSREAHDTHFISARNDADATVSTHGGNWTVSGIIGRNDGDFEYNVKVNIVGYVTLELLMSRRPERARMG